MNRSAPLQNLLNGDLQQQQGGAPGPASHDLPAGMPLIWPNQLTSLHEMFEG